MDKEPKKKKLLEPQTILDIYTRHVTFHDSFPKIEHDLQIMGAQVVFDRFEKCVTGEKPPTRYNYEEALRLYKEEEQKKLETKKKELEEKGRCIPPITEEKTASIFSFIFNGISEGINAFVDARINAKIGKVSEEYRKIAEENQQIREVLEEAKVKNWGETLQKKQGGEIT